MTFAIKQLGYLGFEVGDLEAWERFATGVLGLGVAARRQDGGFSLRMDGHAQRFFLTPGPADDLTVIGWQVEGPSELEALASRLSAAGVEVAPGSAAEAEARGVGGLVKLVDPGGIPTEIFFGPRLASEPFVSPLVRSGFVADALGLGHLVVSEPSQEEGRRFYCELLGFRESDAIRCDLHGYKVDILFLHTNARHHSLAFGERQKKRLHHFMIEARSMDDVGLAFDRALKSGVRIVNTLGRHPNDRMFSFYAKTPSGFQFELGFGGREIDDASWEPAVYDHVSEWGHQPPAFLAPEKPRPGGSR